VSSIHQRPNGHHWIFYSYNKKKHTWRLGRTEAEDAEDMQRRLDRLIGFRNLGAHPDPETVAWLMRMGERLHAALVTAGLAEGRGPTTLGELLEAHERRLIARSRKPSTLKNNRVLYKNLTDHLLASRLLRSITLDDADHFRLMLLARGGKDGGPLALATVNNRCRRARGVFKLAADRHWIATNPFREIATGSERNADRDHYVPPEIFGRIIDTSADHELRLLLGLVRYCGLRCPSEIHPLTWNAINWDAGVLIVQSPKTEAHDGKDRREVPIFAPVKPLLLAAWEAAPKLTELMFPRHQTTGQSITSRLESLCRKAGEPLWPKPFVNLRASGEHDALEAGHNINRVAAWWGHSAEIALKHYNRVAKDRETRKAGCGALRPNGEPIDPKQNAKRQDCSQEFATNSLLAETPPMHAVAVRSDSQ
jgi:integrase